MNQVQQCAFELRLADLKRLTEQGENLAGCLLAASSAHDPHAEDQADVIRFLIDSGVPVNETDANGVTPLHRAVRFRSIGAVDLLLKLGADVHATDRKSHSTPLHRAVTNTGAPATAGKHDLAVRIAESLLSHGADPGARNKNGKTPAEYARTPDMKAVFKH